MSGICIDLQHIETSQFHHYVYEIVVPVLFGVITITGLVGNLLVIFVIVSKKQMRTVTNLLLLNLAVSDLLFVCFVPLLTAYNYWHYVEWIIGEEACQFMHFIFNVTAYVTVFTLVLVSIVRYMVVVRNTTTGHLRTKPRILTAIACVWIMSFALSLPVPFYYRVDIRCSIDRDVGLKFGWAFFILGYVLPLFTISLLYVSIIHHIYRKRMSVCTVQGRPRIRSELKTRQAGKMLVTVLFAFFTFLLPIHIQMLLHYYDALPQNDLYQILSIFFNCLAYTNSVINPFIYNHSSKDFRDAFREVVCCHVDPRCQPVICYPLSKLKRQSDCFDDNAPSIADNFIEAANDDEGHTRPTSLAGAGALSVRSFNDGNSEGVDRFGKERCEEDGRRRRGGGEMLKMGSDEVFEGECCSKDGCKSKRAVENTEEVRNKASICNLDASSKHVAFNQNFIACGDWVCVKNGANNNANNNNVSLNQISSNDTDINFEYLEVLENHETHATESHDHQQQQQPGSHKVNKTNNDNSNNNYMQSNNNINISNNNSLTFYLIGNN